MNLYIVVEGENVELEAYKHWIPYVRPEMSYVRNISDISENNFSILSGFGYPQYFQIINDAIEDVNAFKNIDRLIFVVDTEDLTFDEKLREIENNVNISSCTSEFRIVLQDFCIETWALGNQRFAPRKPQDEQLRAFKKIWDVLTLDPAGLPNHPSGEINRAQFAYRYFKLLVQEKHRNLSYSKRNPHVLLPRHFFDEIQCRFEQYGHIKSFQTFLNAIR